MTPFPKQSKIVTEIGIVITDGGVRGASVFLRILIIRVNF